MKFSIPPTAPILIFILYSVFLLPPANAQDGGLFVLEHNITYTLNENDFDVEETIVFGNAGNPFTFDDKIVFQRGNARDVEVTGARRHDIDYTTYPTKITIHLMIMKGQRFTIKMRYKESDMLDEQNSIKLFEGAALRKYPWLVNNINIKFIAPEGYQFGYISPQPTSRETDFNRMVLIYKESIFNNLTAIQDGFPVKIEYARFRDLAFSDIKMSRDRILEAEYDIEDANSTIENAENYDTNLTNARELYSDAVTLISNARTQLKLAELQNDPVYEGGYDPYRAYLSAGVAKSLAKESSRKATGAKNLANFEIQRALERKISDLSLNVTKKSQLLEEDVNKRLEEITKKPDVEKRPHYPGYLKYSIPLLIVLVIAGVLLRSRKQEHWIKKGRVSDFKVIGDLKRKTFNGFEKKVDTVKKGEEIADRIVMLRKDKEKLKLGIKNSRMKLESGEITEKQFIEEETRLNKKIAETDKEIYSLEKELKDLKKMKKMKKIGKVGKVGKAGKIKKGKQGG